MLSRLRTCALVAALVATPCAAFADTSATLPSSPAMLASLGMGSPAYPGPLIGQGRTRIIGPGARTRIAPMAGDTTALEEIPLAITTTAPSTNAGPEDDGDRIDDESQGGKASSWWVSVDRFPPKPDGVGPDEVWVHINADEQSLTLMKGSDRLQYVDHVAFGAGGAKTVRLRGSRLTPKGDFRIDQINPQSQYHRFFRIDYPNPAVAQQALAKGVISQATHDYIQRYYARHGRAPMDTPLGGYLGLHGLGNKNAFLHQRVEWTDGCTAVTNEEISALEPWLALGTRVIIE